MTTPASLWSRPDDAARQVQLDAMRRRATGLLALAAGVFAVARSFEGRYPWLGFVRATAEASLVGGLADWFAVTALFRHPLGIPIPHTAIVATRKERIGRVLGNFVQSHFLTRDVIAAKLRAVRPAERAARWLSRVENSRRIAQQVASGVAKTLDALPDDDDARPGAAGADRAAPRDPRGPGARQDAVARAWPAIGTRSCSTRRSGSRPQAVHDNRELIREQVRPRARGGCPAWWTTRSTSGSSARSRSMLQRHRRRSAPPAAGHVRHGAAGLRRSAGAPRRSPSPRAEALKEEWLADPSVADLSGRLWETTRGAVTRFATRAEGAEPGPLERGISAFGTALLANEALLAEIDDVVIDLTAVGGGAVPSRDRRFHRPDRRRLGSSGDVATLRAGGRAATCSSSGSTARWWAGWSGSRSTSSRASGADRTGPARRSPARHRTGRGFGYSPGRRRGQDFAAAIVKVNW